MSDPTVAPLPLREAFDAAVAAPVALLALGMPLCPACELLPASLTAIRQARPDLHVGIAGLSSPEEWADREALLWPRGIHVSRASVPVIVLLRDGALVATRQGGGTAHAIDEWLTGIIGPAAEPVPDGISGDEQLVLDQIGDLRRRRLAARAVAAHPLN